MDEECWIGWSNIAGEQLSVRRRSGDQQGSGRAIGEVSGVDVVDRRDQGAREE